MSLGVSFWPGMVRQNDSVGRLLLGFRVSKFSDIVDSTVFERVKGGVAWVLQQGRA